MAAIDRRRASTGRRSGREHVVSCMTTNANHWKSFFHFYGRLIKFKAFSEQGWKAGQESRIACCNVLTAKERETCRHEFITIIVHCQLSWVSVLYANPSFIVIRQPIVPPSPSHM